MKANWRFLILLSFPLLEGCSIIGTGHRVVVRYECPASESDKSGICHYLHERYPNLVAASGQKDRVMVIDANGSPRQISSNESAKNLANFRTYLLQKYGDEEFLGARLNANFYDRALEPPYAPYDTTVAYATMLATLLPTKKYTLEEIMSFHNILEAQTGNVPELRQVTVRKDFGQHHNPRYFYYPHVALDFSVQFPSTSPYDHISYLALIVRLKGCPYGADAKTECARFLNMSPKAADIVDFSRGSFSRALQAQLQAGDALAKTVANTVGAGTATTSTTTNASTLTPTGSVSLNETYQDTLPDQVERRSNGFIDGQTLFSELRSVRQIRVAGTYSYDFFIEVPSTLENKKSKPIANPLKADIALIGVVRHVFKRGFKGTFTKVPEIDNDNVYEQVIVQMYPNAVLWQYPEGSYYQEKPTCTLRVVTNRDDAVFVVRDEVARKQFAGQGKEFVVSLQSRIGKGVKEPEPKDGKPQEEECANSGCCATVDYLPTVIGADKEKLLRFVATQSPAGLIRIPLGKDQTVMGDYEPQIEKK